MGPKPPENINEIVARKAPGNRSVAEKAQTRSALPEHTRCYCLVVNSATFPRQHECFLDLSFVQKMRRRWSENVKTA